MKQTQVTKTISIILPTHRKKIIKPIMRKQNPPQLKIELRINLKLGKGNSYVYSFLHHYTSMTNI